MMPTKRAWGVVPAEDPQDNLATKLTKRSWAPCRSPACFGLVSDYERARDGPDGFTTHESGEEISPSANGSGTLDHHGRSPPSPFEQPGIRVIETKLNTASLTAGFGKIATPHAAASILHSLIGESDREHFVALFLNGRHHITHAHIVSRGTVQSASVHPREVFKAAVLANATAVIVGHNHPSGNVQPSSEDKAVGERLEKVGKLLGIPVLDSLIVEPAGRFYAASVGDTQKILPAVVRNPQLEAGSGEGDLAAICRGLLQDIDEVLERQGEVWWDETVTAGTSNRSQAEKRLGLSPYRPLEDDGESPDAQEPPVPS